MSGRTVPTSSLRSCCADRFQRGGRCGVDYASDIARPPADLPVFAIHAKRGFCLWRELGFSGAYLRMRLRDFLVRPGGAKRWTSSVTFDGVRVEAMTDGRWSIVDKSGGGIRGEGLIDLAACLYGLSKGLAAVAILEVLDCGKFDPITAREIAAAIERGVERSFKPGNAER